MLGVSSIFLIIFLKSFFQQGDTFIKSHGDETQEYDGEHYPVHLEEVKGHLTIHRYPKSFFFAIGIFYAIIELVIRSKHVKIRLRMTVVFLRITDGKI